jgi:hypothetical protein
MAGVALCLVSHTNVGKTTLARTLLARDIGAVRDAPHVTEFADEHILVSTTDGDVLTLWDTPGFGDSARLARRMQQSGRPLGWLLSQVWDRFSDRAFWSSQQALRAVREQADVVLYLVNASESPAAAGYVAPEMALLAWVGKPVIVLLNQLGAPQPPAAEDAEVALWRSQLAAWPLVRAVLPLDAFARCWVQELTLLQAVEDVLDGAARQRMQRLRDAWAARQQATFDAAVALLAGQLAAAAQARQTVADSGRMRETVRRLGQVLGLARVGDDPALLAQQALAAQLDMSVRASTADLVALHGLAGAAEGEILARLAAHFDTRMPVDEGKAAVLGGLVTGALAGLKADVASGGLTLGGGLLAGGLLGALGAAGAARAANLVRGLEQGSVGWSDAALNVMAEAALLRYLAVAHFGRGRGDWAAGESPPHWRAVVAQALALQQPVLDQFWRERGTLTAAALQCVLSTAVLDCLRRLYPSAREFRQV